MSQITNVILNMGTNTRQEAKDCLQQVNRFFQDSEIGFVYVNDWHAEESVHLLEVDLAIGAFNYLDLAALFQHLRTIDWRDPAGCNCSSENRTTLALELLMCFLRGTEALQRVGKLP